MIPNFGSVEQVSLTVLVDNKADLIVKSSDQIQYFTEKPLLAEHGFSVLIQPQPSTEVILWDAGVSRGGPARKYGRYEGGDEIHHQNRPQPWTL